MASRDQLSDEELLRRMAGHLKPILAPHIPHEAKPEVRYALGIAWFAAFLGAMAFLWATILYPIHYLATWVLFSLAGSIHLFALLFGEGAMELNGPINNLIFTVEIIGTYALAVSLLILQAARTPDPSRLELLPHVSDRLTLRGYARVLLGVLTYLPHLGITCLGLGQPAGESPASSGHDLLTACAGTSLVIVQSVGPLTMETVWKQLTERFPGTLTGQEQPDKALLLSILRSLAEARLVSEERFDLGQLSDRTQYRATDTLRVYFSRSRGLGSRIDAPAPAQPKQRPEPPPDLVSPEPPGGRPVKKE